MSKLNHENLLTVTKILEQGEFRGYKSKLNPEMIWELVGGSQNCYRGYTYFKTII